jgi:hypothetical protein
LHGQAWPPLAADDFSRLRLQYGPARQRDMAQPRPALMARILLADDDEDMVEICSRLLPRRGHVVAVARNA